MTAHLAARAGSDALVALVLSAPEHEAAAEHHDFLGVPSIVWQVVNLSLFLVLLVVLLKKPAAKFFGDRRREVEEMNRKAEADRKRAEELASQIQVRLAGIEVEIQKLRTHSMAESEAEQAALVKQTEVDAARIIARGSQEIDIRVREARQELTAYAGDLAVEMANEILKKSVTREDQERLVAEGMDGIKKLAAVPGKR